MGHGWKRRGRKNFEKVHLNYSLFATYHSLSVLRYNSGMRRVYTGIDIGTYHVKAVIAAPGESPETADADSRHGHRHLKGNAARLHHRYQRGDQKHSGGARSRRHGGQGTGENSARRTRRHRAR